LQGGDYAASTDARNLPEQHSTRNRAPPACATFGSHRRAVNICA